MAQRHPAGRHTPTARSIPGPAKPALLEPKPTGRPQVPTAPIKVRATQTGYYDDMRQREGDVFTIANEQAFSHKWMERVHPATRERTTDAGTALKHRHDELLGGTISKVERADDDVFGD